jgi:hypothetical protein
MMHALCQNHALRSARVCQHFLEQQRSGKTYALGTAINEQPICYIQCVASTPHGRRVQLTGASQRAQAPDLRPALLLDGEVCEYSRASMHAQRADTAPPQVIYAMESFRLLMQPPNDKVVLMFDL